MGDLFTAFLRRVDVNARVELEAYARELPEYRKEVARASGRAEMLDYAVWTRRRTAELAREDRPLADEDRAFIAAIGNRRAKQGFSLTAARQVLALHATLMLGEIHAATGPDHMDDLLHLTAWFGPQGVRGAEAFLDGYLDGQQQVLPAARRIQFLAQMLLTSDPAAPNAAQSLGTRVHDHYVATVLLTQHAPANPSDEPRGDLVQAVFNRHQTPMIWQQPDELIALVPNPNPGPVAGGGLSSIPEPDERPLAVVRDCADMLGRPCSVGAAAGAVHGLREAVDLARRVAQVAPVETAPRSLYNVSDVFVELGVANLPPVDHWLRDVGARLRNGPDLLTTLDAFYRNDMSRLRTAACLQIHPRTLDYRLNRVREVVDIDPTSARGVRILTAVTAGILRRAWT